ncbi:MAG: galactose mutarotase, partial [Hyphomicrobiales bacterium]|nr:galactose mutarotase [Hyphomicrobiales bacterium]
MDTRTFGEIDGKPCMEATIRSQGGATAKIIGYGAVIRDLVVPAPGGPRRVVLGLDTLDDYLKHSPHFGALAGRCANRIAGGKFTLDGRDYAIPTNDHGKHSLHGGGKGFGKRVWTLAASDTHSATLTLHSPDGEAGYPGALDASCTYRFADAATLRIEIEARADAPTLCNLALHSYFNLDGSADARDHEVRIGGSFRTPADSDLIPTGEIVAVAGTDWDFRRARPVRNPKGVLYDDNFVIEAMPGADGLAFAASARSPRDGFTLEVHTDQPGVQFYDGAKVACPVPGLGGARYGAHAGLCFEPQTFPDAIHRRHFPSPVLRPGEV